MRNRTGLWSCRVVKNIVCSAVRATHNTDNSCAFCVCTCIMQFRTQNEKGGFRPNNASREWAAACVPYDNYDGVFNAGFVPSRCRWPISGRNSIVGDGRRGCEDLRRLFRERAAAARVEREPAGARVVILNGPENKHFGTSDERGRRHNTETREPVV